MKETCTVCMHRCRLKPGQFGRCGARKNVNGMIVCENYGRITALALDPIEKNRFLCFILGASYCLWEASDATYTVPSARTMTFP